MRVSVSSDPFTDRGPFHPLGSRGSWPCRWIALPGAKPPYCCAFRRFFSVRKSCSIRVHVSADERYELFLDGKRIGRGPECGDRANWYFETYDLTLSAGKHSLISRVTAMGDIAPFAQLTVSHGFMLAVEKDRWQKLLATGIAPWEVKQLGGYSYQPAHYANVGPLFTVDGARFDWGFETGAGSGWRPAEIQDQAVRGDWFQSEIHPKARFMKPASLPPMLDAERSVGVARFVGTNLKGRIEMRDHLAEEAVGWTALLQQGIRLKVPPYSNRRVIVDLEDYYCAYPELIVSQGRASRVEIAWEEALYLDDDLINKGNRNEIDGRLFPRRGDVFISDGAAKRKFETLWWRAGRYVQLLVETKEEALVIETLLWRETRYPLEMESAFSANDERLLRVIPIAMRCLQMDLHDIFADSPYYEQLMYVGDARLEALVTYVVTRDARLPRKTLQLFDSSRLPNGLTQARYPSRAPSVIPPFSLWWVAMIHDFASWRDDRPLVASLLPGARGVIDGFLRYQNKDGLIEAPPGWNFVDWVSRPGWDFGMPPDGCRGSSGIINWHFVLTLRLLAELEEAHAEWELVCKWRRLATQFTERLTKFFWNENRGLFADDVAHAHFSEHAQCLAILAGTLPAAFSKRISAGLLEDRDLARTTIYFTHYLFETYRTIGRMDALFQRMDLWFELERMGFKTTFEAPEPSRSDCHAWGAHPLYHYFTSILGIHPNSMGFRTVRIAPQLGPLERAAGKLVHPSGEIYVEFAKEKRRLHGTITLPPGLSGIFTCAGITTELKAGQTHRL